MKRLSAFAGLVFAFILLAGSQPAWAIDCVDDFQAADPASTCCGLGAFNCNNNSADGCECRPRNSCFTARCEGSGCAQMPVADDTFCPDAAGCPGQGICRAGACVCGTPGGGTWTPPDMGTKTGHMPGGCTYAQTTTGAGLAASVLALVVFIGFAFRRRRS